VIGQAVRTLLVFAALLGTLAVAGLAHPPRLPALFAELAR